MTEPVVICPSCRNSIKLTESLAAPLVAETKRKFEAELAEREAEFRKRDESIQAEKESLKKLKAGIDDEVTAKLKVERDRLATDEAKREAEYKKRDELLRAEKEKLKNQQATLEEDIAEKMKKEKTRIADEEAKKAKRLFGEDLEKRDRALKELQEILLDRDAKLDVAQKEQAEMVRLKRELADEKRSMELTIQQRITDSLLQERAAAKREAEDELGMKVKEKELLITQMQKQIEELKQRAEQGSQQLQGEVLELELEALLKGRFPLDKIEEVKKGASGADIKQIVNGLTGASLGTILWETKRTKTWQDGWLPKLRDDQREEKADLTILVSQVLPKGVEHFDLIDGVWVTGFRTLLPVALVLRQSLLEIAISRQAGEGQQTKMQLVYQYLTGPNFKQRLEAIVEKFDDLYEDLNKERNWMTKQWAKREKQIQAVMESANGLYGDLHGIAGKSLQEIAGLEPPMIAYEGASA